METIKKSSDLDVLNAAAEINTFIHVLCTALSVNGRYKQKVCVFNGIR